MLIWKIESGKKHQSSEVISLTSAGKTFHVDDLWETVFCYVEQFYTGCHHEEWKSSIDYSPMMLCQLTVEHLSKKDFLIFFFSLIIRSVNWVFLSALHLNSLSYPSLSNFKLHLSLSTSIYFFYILNHTVYYSYYEKARGEKNYGECHALFLDIDHSLTRVKRGSKMMST